MQTVLKTRTIRIAQGCGIVEKLIRESSPGHKTIWLITRGGFLFGPPWNIVGFYNLSNRS